MEDTFELMQEFKRKSFASEKQCTKCKYYVENYKDDYTLRHFGYGEVKIRPACSHCGNYGFVSHNPAYLCDSYKLRESEE